MPAPNVPQRLTRSEEDYLKALYLLTEWDDAPVGTGALADQLGLSPASATAMVQKLGAKQLVNYVPRGAITLSPAGLREALRMVRRHRLIETFLHRELGYTWDEIHDEAEDLEHSVTDRFIDALDRRLGSPERDPHGDAIPRPDGSLVQSTAQRLDRYTGAAAIVDRISDEDPEFLRRASAMGVVPGARVALPVPLTDIEASLVWVRAESAG